jgi:hypothetical protein
VCQYVVLEQEMVSEEMLHFPKNNIKGNPYSIIHSSNQVN